MMNESGSPNFLVPMLLRGNALSLRLRLVIRRQEPTIQWVPTQEHGNQIKCGTTLRVVSFAT